MFRLSIYTTFACLLFLQVASADETKHEKRYQYLLTQIESSNDWNDEDNDVYDLTFEVIDKQFPSHKQTIRLGQRERQSEFFDHLTIWSYRDLSEIARMRGFPGVTIGFSIESDSYPERYNFTSLIHDVWVETKNPYYKKPTLEAYKNGAIQTLSNGGCLYGDYEYELKFSDARALNIAFYEKYKNYFAEEILNKVSPKLNFKRLDQSPSGWWAHDFHKDPQQFYELTFENNKVLWLYFHADNGGFECMTPEGEDRSQATTYRDIFLGHPKPGKHFKRMTAF